MSLEEPDTATAGAAPRDREGDDAREHRLMRLLGVGAITVVVAVAVALVIAGRNDRRARDEVSSSRVTSASSLVRPEVDAAAVGPAASSTTSTSIALAGPASSDPPAPDNPGAATSVDAPAAPPSTSEAPPAQVPGLPLVAVGPADASDQCTASWAAADGGSPIVRYEVTRESAPVPPAPDGTEIGTALQLERTTDTTGTLVLGQTIRVSAENALGSGPVTDPIVCA